MVTFNKAEFRKDENGITFLDLEIQAVLEDNKIIIRNSFPSTADIEKKGAGATDLVENAE